MWEKIGIVFFCFVWFVLCPVIVTIRAKNQKRNVFGWAVLSFFIGIFGVGISLLWSEDPEKKESIRERLNGPIILLVVICLGIGVPLARTGARLFPKLDVRINKVLNIPDLPVFEWEKLGPKERKSFEEMRNALGPEFSIIFIEGLNDGFSKGILTKKGEREYRRMVEKVAPPLAEIKEIEKERKTKNRVKMAVYIIVCSTWCCGLFLIFQMLLRPLAKINYLFVFGRKKRD